jgi:hypothetical protein
MKKLCCLIKIVFAFVFVFCLSVVLRSLNVLAPPLCLQNGKLIQLMVYLLTMSNGFISFDYNYFAIPRQSLQMYESLEKYKLNRIYGNGNSRKFIINNILVA